MRICEDFLAVCDGQRRPAASAGRDVEGLEGGNRCRRSISLVVMKEKGKYSCRLTPDLFNEACEHNLQRAIRSSNRTTENGYKNRLDLGFIYISPSGVVGGMVGTLLFLPLDDAPEISFLAFR